MSSRSGRQPCSFSALNPQDPDSKWKSGKLQWQSQCSSKGHVQTELQTGSRLHLLFQFGGSAKRELHALPQRQRCYYFYNVPTCSLDKVVTIDDQISFERNHSAPEESGGKLLAEQIDFRIHVDSQKFYQMSNWLERKKNKLKTKVLLVKNQMQYVLNSPNKDMLIKDLLKHQNVKKDNEAFHPISSDAKIIRAQGNLEKHEILQLEDRVHCRRILKGISAQVQVQVRMIVTGIGLETISCGTKQTNHSEHNISFLFFEDLRRWRRGSAANV